MSNGLRRLLAHLAVPRTLRDLSYRIQQDPYVDASQEELQAAFDEAVEKEWVANLGSHDEPSEVVKAVSAADDAVDFGKGQGKIWQARAEAGLFDVEGDFYVLSQDGLEALRGNDDDPDPGTAERRAVPAQLGGVLVASKESS
jgi:hypothetical protein